MARTLTHFPAFYYWFVRTANDPAAYNQLFDIAWKLALVFGCAFAADGDLPSHQAAGGAPGSAPSANGAAPAQTLAMADPPSSAAAVTAGQAAATAPQSGARLAVAGAAAVRAGTSRARIAAGARLRRRRHDVVAYRDRRSCPPGL